jgi:hypothetical protein
MQEYNCNYDSTCHPVYGRWIESIYQNISPVTNHPVMN